MTITKLIEQGVKTLNYNKIEDSHIKARMLLEYILQKDKQKLLINCNEEVLQEKEERYFQHIQELIDGKPLQYIIHKQEFMGLNFYVDENVLIPQPDTEILVEETIKVIENKIEVSKKEKKGNDVIRILDLCTGSGAIAVSIAKKFKECEVYGSDISENALEIAKKNARENKVKVKFFVSDMFEEVKQNVDQPFDIIVSNPPYIREEVIKTLPKEVQNEPHIALFGGEDGLDFYKIIAEKAHIFLKKDGYLLLEIGYDQKESVTKLFQEIKQCDRIECIKDLSGNDRVIKVSHWGQV